VCLKTYMVGDINDNQIITHCLAIFSELIHSIGLNRRGQLQFFDIATAAGNIAEVICIAFLSRNPRKNLTLLI